MRCLQEGDGSAFTTLYDLYFDRVAEHDHLTLGLRKALYQQNQVRAGRPFQSAQLGGRGGLTTPVEPRRLLDVDPSPPPQLVESVVARDSQQTGAPAAVARSIAWQGFEHLSEIAQVIKRSSDAAACRW